MEYILQMKGNLILSFLLIVMLLSIFFDFSNMFKKYFDLRINRLRQLIGLTAVLFAAFFSFLDVSFLFSFFLIIFTLWAFLFGFNANRKYIYLLALIFLGVTPFLLLLNIESIAEYSAVLSYLLLVLGVTKDLFYEQIFKE